MKIALWTTRILLTLMILYWMAAIPQLAIAYHERGMEGVDSKIVHWAYTNQDPANWQRVEPQRLTASAYQVFIFGIVVTWALRELHAALLTRVKRKVSAS